MRGRVDRSNYSLSLTASKLESDGMRRSYIALRTLLRGCRGHLDLLVRVAREENDW